MRPVVQGLSRAVRVNALTCYEITYMLNFIGSLPLSAIHAYQNKRLLALCFRVSALVSRRFVRHLLRRERASCLSRQALLVRSAGLVGRHLAAPFGAQPELQHAPDGVARKAAPTSSTAGSHRFPVARAAEP